MIKSVDGHNIACFQRDSKNAISFYPDGLRGGAFIGADVQRQDGSIHYYIPFRLDRNDVHYLIAALQRHLDETEGGEPWWEVAGNPDAARRDQFDGFLPRTNDAARAIAQAARRDLEAGQ